MWGQLHQSFLSWGLVLMMFEFVKINFFLVFVALATDVTGVRFQLAVSVLVNSQHIRKSESSSADVALKLLFACVNVVVEL